MNDRAIPAIYVASPLGFAESTRFFYSQILLPRLTGEGWRISDPWRDGPPTAEMDAEAAALRSANARLGQRNADEIRGADAVMAVLDGADVDSGTAAEIGYASALGTPIVGLRSDFRMSGDNAGARVNLQVEWFIEASGGQLVTDLDSAVSALRRVLAHTP